MEFNVKVFSEKKFYLLSQLEMLSIMKEEERRNSNYSSKREIITFVIDHISEHYEDGYHPPRDILIDFIRDVVQDKIRDFKIKNVYKLYCKEFTLETIFVSDRKLKFIDKEDLQNYKMSRVSLPIKRKTMSNLK
jgi:hypothetical protein